VRWEREKGELASLTLISFSLLESTSLLYLDSIQLQEMSTTTSAPLASTSSLPQSSPPRLTASPSSQSQSPTIHVHYASRHVKARIDPGVPLPEIIRQLVSSSQLSISEPSTLFCLRIKESGQLLTPSNFHSLLTREVGKKNVLILGSSPEIEAIETLDKLSPTSSLPTLKLATFSLKTLIKDKEFRGEFLERRNGWETLMDVVERSSGNTLAYALNVVRDVLELDQEGGGKRKCEKEFVKRIVEIVGEHSTPAKALFPFFHSTDTLQTLSLGSQLLNHY